LRQQPLHAVSLCVLTVASVKIFRFTTDVILVDVLEVRGPCVYEKVCVLGFKDFPDNYQLTVHY
jgi:hypothetical protein